MPAAKIWDAKRNLYRKLLENPGLTTGNSILTGFKNAIQGSHLATFSQADLAIRFATNITSAAQETRDNTILSNDLNEAQVEALLSSINYDLALASPSQVQILGVLESQISTQFNGRNVLDQAWSQQVTANLDAANAINEALQPTNVQEQVRKDLNRLIIKKLRTAPLTETDYQAISNIAAQAENSIGASVPEAVLLLSNCDQNEFISQESAANRDAGIDPVQSDVLKTAMQIFPNPSDGQFRVMLNKPLNGILRIVNTSGQSIKRIELTLGQHEVYVNMSGQTSGVYFLVLQSANGNVSESSCIVIH